MSCVFCQIVRHEATAPLVAEAAQAVAFLDARPLFKGHVLVVPKAHVVTLGDLAAEDITPLFALVQQISLAVVAGLGADGSFVAANNIVSQSVPHLHVHVVPRKKGDGLKGFFWPRQKYSSDEERDGYARRIATAMLPSADGGS